MKRIYLLLILVTTVISCQKDEISSFTENEIQQKNKEQQLIDFKDLPQSILQNFDNQLRIISKSSKKNMSLGAVRTDVPVNKIKRKGGTTNYTFGLKTSSSQKSSALYFDNFVVQELESGEQLQYIIRYEPEGNWYYSKFKDLAHYSGKIKIYNLKGKIIGNMKVTNGEYIKNPQQKANDELECMLVLDNIFCVEDLNGDGGYSCSYNYRMECRGTSGSPDPVNETPSNPTDPGNWNNEPTGGGDTNGRDPDIDTTPILDEDVWPSDIILLTQIIGAEITDMAKYLDCFNLNSGAVFTLYADQPTPNSSTAWSSQIDGVDVGHTFISIKQNGINRVIGFYPKNGVRPVFQPNSPRQDINDSGHHFDVSISKNITSTQLNILVNALKSNNTDYNLNDYNCTDYGIGMASQVGMNIGSCYGNWPGGGGDNPGKLGQVLRSTSISGIKNKNGGSSPNNSGTCN